VNLLAAEIAHRVRRFGSVAPASYITTSEPTAVSVPQGWLHRQESPR
jgi:hypothetical protein